MKLVNITFGRSALIDATSALTLPPRQFYGLLLAISRLSIDRAFRFLCGIGLGLVGWFGALIVVQSLIDGIFYPGVDAHDYQHSWGGPTLAGAWIVHFLLSLVFLVALIWLLQGLTLLNKQIDPTSNQDKKYWWSIPLAILLALAGIVVLIAWINQL